MRHARIVTVVFLAATVAAPAAGQIVSTQDGAVAVETVAAGLEHPWSLAFLPDGRMLVTERPGRMRIVSRDGLLSAPLAGVPAVFAQQQGGLLDVLLDQDFAANRTIYFCFTEPVDEDGRRLARTALASARLNGEGASSLEDVQVIFRRRGPLADAHDFGCRTAQVPDGSLFFTPGSHADRVEEAQNLGSHHGKVIRIRPDGSVPPDNPFVGRPGALPEIWSLGHRNAQGAAIHPGSGKLWIHEHGPRGGDEINIPQGGANYGWPVIGYGFGYDGAKIHETTRKDGMEQPIWYWRPSIAPSGMAFYTRALFPAWHDDLFVGALAGRALLRMKLDGERVLHEERLLAELDERIRDVRQGRDGAIWILTDNANGRIMPIVPAKFDRPPRTAERFDVNDEWGAVRSTDVLVGSYAIETTGAKRFAWVGPRARIAFPFAGPQNRLNIAGWIPFDEYVRKGVKKLLIEVLAGGRKLGDMRFHEPDLFERSFSLEGISGDQDGNLVVELKSSSSLGPTQTDGRSLSFVVSRIWLE